MIFIILRLIHSILGCKSIGLDVSPPCVEMAKEVAIEEGLQELCQFFQVDVTVDPSLLLNGKCNCLQTFATF